MINALAITLAWRPFLQPLELHGYWLALLPPIVIAVAVVYKTLKLKKLDKLVYETTRLTCMILGLMFVAAVVLWALVEAVERV